MLGTDELELRFNVISHEPHAQIVNRNLLPLYSIWHLKYSRKNIINTHK